jgi:hypothetical protein
MAVAKSWEASRKEIREQMAKEQRKKADDIELPEEVGTLDDELKTTYFKEFLKLYAVLGELVVESGGMRASTCPPGFVCTRRLLSIVTSG